MFISLFVETFAFQFQKHEDLDSSIQEYKKVLEGYAVPFDEQPFMVYCGSLANLTCCHVVYGSVVYKFDTPLDATDFLYKSFFVLRIDYPLACQHIWGFLQKYAF